MNDLEEIVAFRNRLVSFFNYVIASYERGRSSQVVGIGDPDIDDSAMRHIRSEQVALTQEYGRLRGIITSHVGIARMNIPAVGIVSQDVILDAINRVGWHNWSDAAQMAQQHLDVTIGQMQAQPRRKRPVRGGTQDGRPSGRVIGALIALALFIVAGLMSGVLEDLGREVWRSIFGS